MTNREFGVFGVFGVLAENRKYSCFQFNLAEQIFGAARQDMIRYFLC